MLPNLDYERRLQALERFMREIRGDRGASAVATWTPAFAGDGTAGTFTYTNQQGAYILNGNNVIINGRVSISAIAVNPTGNMQISLPLAAASDAGNYGVIPFASSNLDFDAGYTFAIGQIQPGNQFMDIVECGDNVARAIIQGSTFDNNVAVNILFSGMYRI